MMRRKRKGLDVMCLYFKREREKERESPSFLNLSDIRSLPKEQKTEKRATDWQSRLLAEDSTVVTLRSTAQPRPGTSVVKEEDSNGKIKPT